jgi:integrase
MTDMAQMLRKGGTAMLRELMRHSSLKVTMDYYASVDDALQDAITRVKDGRSLFARSCNS